MEYAVWDISFIFKNPAHFAVTQNARQNLLAHQLLTETVFPQLLEDSKTLVTAEVEKKNVAWRTGFNMMRKAKPDLVDRAMRELLPMFVEALEPFYATARVEPDTDFRNYLLAHQNEVTHALLAASDHRIANASNRIVKSGYQRLRGRAQRDVIASIPGIINVMAKYAD